MLFSASWSIADDFAPTRLEKGLQFYTIRGF